jgi:hypothetical protein
MAIEIASVDAIHLASLVQAQERLTGLVVLNNITGVSASVEHVDNLGVRWRLVLDVHSVDDLNELDSGNETHDGSSYEAYRSGDVELLVFLHVFLGACWNLLDFHGVLLRLG